MNISMWIVFLTRNKVHRVIIYLSHLSYPKTTRPDDADPWSRK